MENSGENRIKIPYLYTPRSYQKPVMAFMDQNKPGLRAITVWHRRSGKDITWLNQIIKRMLLAPYCGTYLHIFPALTQGRRDLWDAKTSPDSGGRPFRAHFPPALVMESSEVEMQITMKPMPHQSAQPQPDGRGGTKKVGSIFQVMGTDDKSIENLRGMNAVGAVFSEFADQNPEAWVSIIEPILLENRGWAAFDFTPKGKNHAWQLWQGAQHDLAWFTQLLTIDDTRRDAEGEDGSRIVDPEQIDGLRSRGVPEEIIQQEYYCSFEGYLHGTIFGDLLKKARIDGRVDRVPYLTTHPVGTMWDIGRTDATAIWFYQCVGSEIRFIDYYANIKQGADHYAKICREKPYLYARMILPHDARVKGYTASQTTVEYLYDTVCRQYDVAEKIPIQTGIDIVRRMFPRFIFDAHHCGEAPNPNVPSGLAGLEGYRRKWDEEKKDYSGEPVHDQFSHPADALRTGCVGWSEGLEFYADTVKRVGEMKVETEFDPRIPIGTRR